MNEKIKDAIMVTIAIIVAIAFYSMMAQGLKGLASH